MSFTLLSVSWSGMQVAEVLPDPRSVRLRVMGLCCDKEIKLVRDSLEPLNGVTRVSVNVLGRVVLVHYDAALVEVTDLVAALNYWQLGCSVQGHHGVQAA